MKHKHHIIHGLAAMAFLPLWLTACSNEEADDTVPQTGSIRINTAAVQGTRAAETDYDNTFTVLFWDNKELATADPQASFWLAPYLVANAPQDVSFYEHSVFDTGYPYPGASVTNNKAPYLYATGYAPGEVLHPDIQEGANGATGRGYAKLKAILDEQSKGRYDFLGCDAWPEVYRGSQTDPFAQEKNKLYFRHLAAKLVFIAERDVEMEGKQYVRNVQVTDLQMSIDGGKNWTPMYTPSEFTWQQLKENDFTPSYSKVIKTIQQNNAVTTGPSSGYKASAAMKFAGEEPGKEEDKTFILERRTKKGISSIDRVPITGHHLDSCYVCNPIENGTVKPGKIQLKMNISAELSYDFNFPESDSGTDDLTFTRTWEGVTLEQINEGTVNDKGEFIPNGNSTINEFKPGNEYRVYIKFHRTGVNLVARELPWNYGGIHYIPIVGKASENP